MGGAGKLRGEEGEEGREEDRRKLASPPVHALEHSPHDKEQRKDQEPHHEEGVRVHRLIILPRNLVCRICMDTPRQCRPWLLKPPRQENSAAEQASIPLAARRHPPLAYKYSPRYSEFTNNTIKAPRRDCSLYPLPFHHSTILHAASRCQNAFRRWKVPMDKFNQDNKLVGSDLLCSLRWHSIDTAGAETARVAAKQQSGSSPQKPF
eukprot:3710258-Rhodomonas_salina.2